MVCAKKTSKLLFSVETDNIWVVKMGMMLFYNGNDVLCIQGAAALMVVEAESEKHLEQGYLILGYIHKLGDGLTGTILSSYACSNTWLKVSRQSLKQSRFIGCCHHVPDCGSWSQLSWMGVAGQQPIYCWALDGAFSTKMTHWDDVWEYCGALFAGGQHKMNHG